MKLNWKSNIVLVFAVMMIVYPLGTYRASAETVVLTEQNPGIGGGLEDELNDLQNQIDALNGQKNDIQGQINANNYTILGFNSQISALYGEAQVFQKSIDETELQIKQIQLKIEKLNIEITEKQREITEKKEVIKTLERESKKRIDESYMKFRMQGANSDVGSNLIFTSNINAYFKGTQYTEVIQNDTNNLLAELAKLKAELEVKKKELDEKLVKQKQDQEQINVKNEDLKNKKSEVDAKMAVFYAKVAEAQGSAAAFQARLSLLSEQEMRLSAEAELIKQQIMLSFVTTGEYVLAGTIIGFQGCTGYCFGEHLHFSVYVNGGATDPCGQLEPGGMSCGVNGPLKTPLRGGTSYNSAFGYRSFDNSFHDGIDVTDYQSGAPVYAAHDGYIQRGVDCWHRDMGYPTNGCANFVKIAQNRGSNSGYVTGYWHLR